MCRICENMIGGKKCLVQQIRKEVKKQLSLYFNDLLQMKVDFNDVT